MSNGIIMQKMARGKHGLQEAKQAKQQHKGSETLHNTTQQNKSEFIWSYSMPLKGEKGEK